MKLLWTSVVAAGVVGSHGASEEFELAFQQLSGCHVSFGMCVSNVSGFVTSDRTLCLNETVRDAPTEVDQTQIVDWVQAYASADAFEADATNAQDSGLYLARLKSSVKAYKADLDAAGALYGDFVFCDDSTWSVVSGSVDNVRQIDFKVPLTEAISTSPIFRFFDDLSSSAGIRVRYISNALARGVDDIAEFQARADNIIDGPTTVRRARASTNGYSSFTVSSMNVPEAVKWAASEPTVVWVEPIRLMEATNYEASAMTQTGTELMNTVDSREGATPFWDRGILGQGQVVGVGDSGLDTSQCMFSDSSFNDTEMLLERYALESNVDYNETTGVITIDPTINTRIDYPNHRKVIQYVSYASPSEGGVAGHGTHCAGSVAGSLAEDNLDATSGVVARNATRWPSNNFQGMAPAAKLTMFDMGTPTAPYIFAPDDYSDLFQPAYEVGARIHTNSWGSSWQFNDANIESNDKYVFEHQDFLVLFAAGNSGDGGLFTIGSPAIGKNMIAVGATQSAERSWAFIRETYGLNPFDCSLKTVNGTCGEGMAEFSSNGPTFDGRIKPDVSAPGFYIFSASSGPDFQATCEAAPKAGTSMATPVTAGNAALVRQFFMDGYYPRGSPSRRNAFEPMAALVKAVLVNGADFMEGLNWNGGELSSSSPDQFQGFGRVNLGNNLLLDGNELGRETFVMGDFNDMPTFTRTGQTYRHRIQVPENDGGILKATLVWFEPASSPTATLMRVNDLDLTIQAPDGTVVYANGLSTYDRVNQVEQVVIVDPQPGSYKVTIKAHAIRMDDVAQPYAFVSSMNVENARRTIPGSGGGWWYGIIGGGAFCVLLVVGGVLRRRNSNQVVEEEARSSSESVSVNPKYEA